MKKANFFEVKLTFANGTVKKVRGPAQSKKDLEKQYLTSAHKVNVQFLGAKVVSPIDYGNSFVVIGDDGKDELFIHKSDLGYNYLKALLRDEIKLELSYR